MAKENVNQTEIKLDKSDTMGPWQIAWNKFRQNKIAMAGLIIFILIVLAVIFVPIISGVNVNDYSFDTKNIGPNAEHWLGTDQQGRDVFFRFYHGRYHRCPDYGAPWLCDRWYIRLLWWMD